MDLKTKCFVMGQHSHLPLTNFI